MVALRTTPSELGTFQYQPFLPGKGWPVKNPLRGQLLRSWVRFGTKPFCPAKDGRSKIRFADNSFGVGYVPDSKFLKEFRTLPACRNWQTRQTQNLLRATVCGFKSHCRHLRRNCSSFFYSPMRFATTTKRFPSLAPTFSQVESVSNSSPKAASAVVLITLRAVTFSI